MIKFIMYQTIQHHLDYYAIKKIYTKANSM